MQTKGDEAIIIQQFLNYNKLVSEAADGDDRCSM